MRKNIASVIDAFHSQERYQDKTCRTDGERIYSYALLIAVCHGSTVYVLDPSESPSRTTTGHIRAVMAAFPGHRLAGEEASLTRLATDGANYGGSEASNGAREDFHADG